MVWCHISGRLSCTGRCITYSNTAVFSSRRLYICNNSFYFAEEVLSTYHYKQLIRANDRATLLNLMIGLNAYTLCSGIICEDLNGNDYKAVPLKETEKMRIGYIKRKGAKVSHIGELYIEELKKYKEKVM